MKRLLIAIGSLFASNIHAAVIPTQADTALGLYPAKQFATVQGKCNDCNITPQALWYFKNELIAVPSNNLDAKDLPPLVWTGSISVITEAKIDGTGKALTLKDGENLSFAIVPKISTNLSYWNESTQQFFMQGDIRLRGELKNNQFIARTVWPLNYRLDLSAKPQSLDTAESLRSLVQFENGGAKSPFESRLLWGNAGNHLYNKPVLGIVLNGAQGDDDEAHGGHFAIATGRIGLNGDMSNWLVNNYYNLASNSEKGIIAAPTPLDKYLADVNNGQNYYRPSYMLVAVFKQERVPAQFQVATNRVYQRFYRNDFVYDHSRDNCAGISIDTLRNLGWNIPTRGVTSQLKATAAYFYVAATEKSLTKGRAIYDYLNTETTRLLPAVAFDAIGNDLLTRLLNPASKVLQNGALEKLIAQDIEALYFVRIPQIPSSRAFGLAPVYSFDQYMAQAPADKSQWKIIPTTPNLLPNHLKNGLSPKLEKPNLVPWPVVIVVLILFAALVAIARKLSKK